MPHGSLVVLTADANYAGQLAVTLQSIDDSLRDGEQIDALVLATMINETLRSKVTANLTRVKVRWIDVPANRFENLPIRAPYSRATYSRLLWDEFVPDDVETAIYLDVDIIVRQSILDLASVPLEGALFGACIDLNVLFVASPIGLPDWGELGLAPTVSYLNGGVLLFNVRRWREERFTQELLEYLEVRGNKTRWLDQDALNACGAERWKPLDVRWNILPLVDPRNCWANGFMPHDELLRAYEDPWLVHYVYLEKPWRHEWMAAPFADLWWQTADRTAFDFDTRPPRPPFVLRTVRSVRRSIRSVFRTLLPR